MLGHATDTGTVKNIVSEIDHQGKIEQHLGVGELSPPKYSNSIDVKSFTSPEILMDFFNFNIIVIIFDALL